MELNFDIFKSAWNKLKTTNLLKLKQAVPGLINPDYIYVKRIQENEEYLTVMFKGFDKALNNVVSGTPLLKREILNWVQKFATVQIERGDDESFIIRISKNLRLKDKPVVIETINHNDIDNKYHNELVIISRISPVME